MVAGVEPILFPFVDPNPLLDFGIDALDDVDGAANTIRVDTPHGLDTGDAVLYENNEDDESIGTLVDGTTYFARVDAQNPALITLHASRADALAGTGALDLAPVAVPEDLHTLAAGRTFNAGGAVDGSANTIALGPFAGLADGDAVRYFNGGDDDFTGVQDGGLYFVAVDGEDSGAVSVRLFASRTAALAAGEEIDLEPGAGTTHRIVKTTDAYHSLRLELDPAADVNDADNNVARLDHVFRTGDAVVYRATARRRSVA